MKEFPRSSVVQSVDLFWELLVAYVNADKQVPPRWANLSWTKLVPIYESPFDRITHLLLASGIVYGLLRIEADFNPREPRDPGDRSDHIFRATSNQLKRHHGMLKRTLGWLCSPKRRRSIDLREIEPLRRKSKALVPGRYPMINEEDETIISYLEEHGLSSAVGRLYLLDSFQGGRRLFFQRNRWKQAIDPFCAFLLEGCLGKRFNELPAKLCARRKCGRFFVPIKKTGEFCSDSCRARNFWTPKKRRDYMREWRLKRLPPGVRRRKTKTALPGEGKNVSC
jgi:hypothetical protein